jgi:hypothetical protein
MGLVECGMVVGHAMNQHRRPLPGFADTPTE